MFATLSYSLHTLSYFKQFTLIVAIPLECFAI